MSTFGGKADVTNSRSDARPGLTFCYNKIRRFRLRPALRLNLGRMKMATREARLAEFSQAPGAGSQDFFFC
jgi:hypothetical protein